MGLLRSQTECSFKTSNRKILPDPYRPFLARSLGDSSRPFLTPFQIPGPSKPPYSPLLGRSLESHSRLPYRSSSRVPSIPHYCSSLEYLVILPIITTLFWQKEPPSILGICRPPSLNFQNLPRKMIRNSFWTPFQTHF